MRHIDVAYVCSEKLIKSLAFIIIHHRASTLREEGRAVNCYSLVFVQGMRVGEWQDVHRRCSSILVDLYLDEHSHVM